MLSNLNQFLLPVAFRLGLGRFFERLVAGGVFGRALDAFGFHLFLHRAQLQAGIFLAGELVRVIAGGGGVRIHFVGRFRHGN